MRMWHRAFLLPLVLLVAACGAQSDLPGATPTEQPEIVLDVDPAAFVAVDYRRSGGIAGLDEHAQLFKDGHVELERSDGERMSFQLTPQELALIDAAFNQVDFHRNARQTEAIPSMAADALQYEITRSSLLLQSTLVAADDTMPEWAQPLIPLLDNLLLSPEPQPERMPAPGQATAQEEATTNPNSMGQLVLVEFRRGGGPEQADDWVLVHLDRTYSVARNGVVQSGQLTEVEMAALLRMLEAADLSERQGTYVPEAPEAGALTYELAYRNLYGQYRVRAAGDAVPGWMQAIADAMVTGFLATDEVVMAFTPPPPTTPTPTLQARATAVALSEAATETSTATSSPTPSATPTTALTPTATAAPTDTPTQPPTRTPTAAPTDTPTRAPTPTPTAAPMDTPTRAPTPTPTAAPTDTPTRAPTSTPTAAPTDTPTRAPTSTPTAAPTDTPTRAPTPTPTAAPTDTPTRTSTPTPTASPTRPAATTTPTVTVEAEEAYSLQDFMRELEAQGATVELASGQIVKPYLSVPGVIVWVDDQPVQVYIYPDEETLAADVDGLAEDASSIDGMALSWPAAPHFWQGGPLLVLAVTDDAALVELIDAVLGPQFAGR